MESAFDKKGVYRKTLAIAFPVMIQNLITNFVAMIDNIMVGQIGTEPMSAVAIVNQILFVFNVTMFGVVSGAGIFCAQFFGKKDIEGVRDTFRFKILTTMIVSVLGIALFVLKGDFLIEKFLHDSNKGINLDVTFAYAKDYLLIMLLGLIPFSLEQAYSSTLRESGRAVTPMVGGLAAVVVNTLLNYLLIFGIGVFPELGVKGAAIATVISRFVQVGIVIGWTHINVEKLEFVKGLYKTLLIPKTLALKITKKGLIPLISNEFFWSAGVAMLTQCYSVRGIDVVAGLNISNTVVNLFNVMFLSLGAGISVVMGQLLGADEYKTAKQTAPRLIAFSGTMCLVVGIVMASLSKLFPSVYNTTEDVRSLATVFIFISAVTMPVHGMVHSMYFVLRSGGKTLVTFAFDSGFSWCISVPLAFCLANFTSISVIYVYLCCQLLDILKCFMGFFFIKKGVWLLNIVAEV